MTFKDPRQKVVKMTLSSVDQNIAHHYYIIDMVDTSQRRGGDV